VYRLVHRMAGDPDLASDFTQETFIRAFQRLEQFRGDSSLATWLHTIAFGGSDVRSCESITRRTPRPFADARCPARGLHPDLKTRPPGDRRAVGSSGQCSSCTTWKATRRDSSLESRAPRRPGCSMLAPSPAGSRGIRRRSHRMNDDQMDELLAQGARDYNEPGAVRATMRARIARRAASRATRAGGGVRRWVWISGAVAARSYGGRHRHRPAPRALGAEKVSPVAVTPPRSFKAAGSRRDRGQTRSSKRRRLQRPVVASLRLPTIRRRVARRERDAQSRLPAVMLQHLTGSEAMITAFRASARRGE
jgi:hypothetical protein